MRTPLFALVLIAASVGISASPAPPAPVGVNDATEAQLMTVPGVTRAVALRIIAGRPYSSIEQVIVDANLPIETVRVARQRLSLVTYVLPSSRGATSPGAPAGTPARPDGALRLNINTASVDAIVAGVGVSRETARRLVAARPYERVEQFLAVAQLPPEKRREVSGRLVAAELTALTVGGAEPAHVSVAGPGPRPTSTPRRPIPLSERLDINSASVAEIADRCGIPAMMAARIAANRPYRTLKELHRLGLSEPTIRDYGACLRVDEHRP